MASFLFRLKTALCLEALKAFLADDVIGTVLNLNIKNQNVKYLDYRKTNIK